MDGHCIQDRCRRSASRISELYWVEGVGGFGSRVSDLVFQVLLSRGRFAGEGARRGGEKKG